MTRRIRFTGTSLKTVGVGAGPSGGAGHPISRSETRAPLPKPRCSRRGDAPKEPPVFKEVPVNRILRVTRGEKAFEVLADEVFADT
ncbi:MAG: hypothetical protein AAFY88_16950, partial [Acidobacteriota bacterium]